VIDGQCLRLEIDYSYLQAKSNMTEQTMGFMSHNNAEEICTSFGGTLANVDTALFQKVLWYLQLWRFSPEYGSIWIKTEQPSNYQHCSAIHVRL